jgi:hypothetical protein
MTPRLVSLIVAVLTLLVAATASADPRPDGPGPAPRPGCRTAYGTTECGYHCVAAYGDVRCARTPAGVCAAAYGQLTCWDPPRSSRRARGERAQCVPAYGTVACGYGCVAAYGEVRCAQTPQGTCSAAYGQVTCWDPEVRRRRRGE